MGRLNEINKVLKERWPWLLVSVLTPYKNIYSALHPFYPMTTKHKGQYIVSKGALEK